MTSIQSGFLRQRVRALPSALSALEEIPHLDDVALGVLEVDRAVAARVLLGSAHRDAALFQTLHERVERSRLGAERVVHVAAALVAELLLAGQPEPEPRPVAGGEPDPVVVALEDAQAEDVGVEGLERLQVADLERELDEPG